MMSPGSTLPATNVFDRSEVVTSVVVKAVERHSLQPASTG
jgi:hypothetical protein